MKSKEQSSESQKLKTFSTKNKGLFIKSVKKKKIIASEQDDSVNALADRVSFYVKRNFKPMRGVAMSNIVPFYAYKYADELLEDTVDQVSLDDHITDEEGIKQNGTMHDRLPADKTDYIDCGYDFILWETLVGYVHFKVIHLVKFASKLVVHRSNYNVYKISKSLGFNNIDEFNDFIQSVHNCITQTGLSPFQALCKTENKNISYRLWAKDEESAVAIVSKYGEVMDVEALGCAL